MNVVGTYVYIYYHLLECDRKKRRIKRTIFRDEGIRIKKNKLSPVDKQIYKMIMRSVKRMTNNII